MKNTKTILAVLVALMAIAVWAFINIGKTHHVNKMIHNAIEVEANKIICTKLNDGRVEVKFHYHQIGQSGDYPTIRTKYLDQSYLEELKERLESFGWECVHSYIERGELLRTYTFSPKSDLDVLETDLAAVLHPMVNEPIASVLYDREQEVIRLIRMRVDFLQSTYCFSLSGTSWRKLTDIMEKHNWEFDTIPHYTGDVNQRIHRGVRKDYYRLVKVPKGPSLGGG